MAKMTSALTSLICEFLVMDLQSSTDLTLSGMREKTDQIKDTVVYPPVVTVMSCRESD